jgi:hypothetical protein
VLNKVSTALAEFSGSEGWKIKNDQGRRKARLTQTVCSCQSVMAEAAKATGSRFLRILLLEFSVSRREAKPEKPGRS